MKHLKFPILLRQQKKKSKNNVLINSSPEYPLMDNGGVFIMKKFSTAKTDKLILGFVLKVVVSSIASILIFSYIFSQIVYKLDLDLNTSKIFAIIICALSAFVISFISVSGLKNNGLIMGAVSVIPLCFYSLINLVFYNDNVLLFFIKLAVMLLIGALIGMLRTNKSKKFKVK